MDILKVSGINTFVGKRRLLINLNIRATTNHIVSRGHTCGVSGQAAQPVPLA